jgi:hypothetical protein
MGLRPHINITDRVKSFMMIAQKVTIFVIFILLTNAPHLQNVLSHAIMLISSILNPCLDFGTGSEKIYIFFNFVLKNIMNS